MFDTIRFKVTGTEEIYQRIKHGGLERLIWDYANDTQKHVLVYQLIPIKDHLYKIYIQAHDNEHFFVEFSLPKVLFDTNIFMVYPQHIPRILLTVYKEVKDMLGLEISPFDEWIVQRIDYDWVWKFDNHNQAKWVLESLYKYNYPRKGLTKRDTSLTIDGTTEKIIFYLKQEEFKANDYRKFVNNGERVLADWLFDKSANLLRFEISQKKAKLTNVFGREVTYKEVIEESHVISILNDVLSSLCNSDRLISMTYHEMAALIYNTLPKKASYNLLGFANMWYSYDMATREYNQDFLKKTLSPSTLYKNRQKLRDIGVGILVTNPMYNAFDLTIPSKNVINTADEVAGIAKAIGDFRVPSL